MRDSVKNVGIEFVFHYVGRFIIGAIGFDFGNSFPHILRGHSVTHPSPPFRLSAAFAQSY